MNPLSNLPPIVDALGNLIDPSQNPLANTPGTTQAGTGGPASGGDFLQTLTNAIGGLSGVQDSANAAMSGLALNQGTDIHQAMLAMEQASLGMHLAVQVRDKAVDAYQSLINMQM